MAYNKPFFEKGVTIVVGHYGSGKTEFSVNLADQLADAGKKPVLADLDIVNPYFRSRERKAYFAKKGIEVLSSNLMSDEDIHQDLPYLAAAIRTCFESQEQLSIVDVGGDPVGATAIGQYARLLGGKNYNMWIAVNANRPQTKTAEDAEAYLRNIEMAARLKINGILNTTHMLRETEPSDIEAGDRLVRDLSRRTGLPVIFTVALSEVAEKMDESNLAAPLFPIKMFMRPDWL